MKCVFLLVAMLFTPIALSAHCQLPCGIYHDDLRFVSLEEDIQSLNKFLAVIHGKEGLSADTLNQRVRAIALKEEYADKIAHVMTFYFMQQRLKPSDEAFSKQLLSVFNILKLSKDVKSSVDTSIVDQLQQEIGNFKKLYNPS